MTPTKADQAAGMAAKVSSLLAVRFRGNPRVEIAPRDCPNRLGYWVKTDGERRLGIRPTLLKVGRVKTPCVEVFDSDYGERFADPDIVADMAIQVIAEALCDKYMPPEE